MTGVDTMARSSTLGTSIIASLACLEGSAATGAESRPETVSIAARARYWHTNPRGGIYITKGGVSGTASVMSIEDDLGFDSMPGLE
jgi:hypothetical protein